MIPIANNLHLASLLLLFLSEWDVGSQEVIEIKMQNCMLNIVEKKESKKRSL